MRGFFSTLVSSAKETVASAKPVAATRKGNGSARLTKQASPPPSSKAAQNTPAKPVESKSPSASRPQQSPKKNSPSLLSSLRSSLLSSPLSPTSAKKENSSSPSEVTKKQKALHRKHSKLIMNDFVALSALLFDHSRPVELAIEQFLKTFEPKRVRDINSETPRAYECSQSMQSGLTGLQSDKTLKSLNASVLALSSTCNQILERTKHHRERRKNGPQKSSVLAQGRVEARAQSNSKESKLMERHRGEMVKLRDMHMQAREQLVTLREMSGEALASTTSSSSIPPPSSSQPALSESGTPAKKTNSADEASDGPPDGPHGPLAEVAHDVAQQDDLVDPQSRPAGNSADELEAAESPLASAGSLAPTTPKAGQFDL